jgi:hypothetical protein
VTGIEESAGQTLPGGRASLEHHLGAKRRDHHAVVGAEARPRDAEGDARVVAALLSHASLVALFRRV